MEVFFSGEAIVHTWPKRGVQPQTNQGGQVLFIHTKNPENLMVSRSVLSKLPSSDQFEKSTSHPVLCRVLLGPVEGMRQKLDVI
jgi:hypothetical protein